MLKSGAGAVVARAWCRIVGHKWVLVPGISHGHDELHECRRCGQYDWRDLPAAVACEVEAHVEGPPAKGLTCGRHAAASGAGRRS